MLFRSGLLFRVALTPKDGAGRLVVPLELVAQIGAVLERLPAATSPVARRVPDVTGAFCSPQDTLRMAARCVSPGRRERR